MVATLDGMTTAEAARALGLSEQTVRGLVRSGKLPSVRTPPGSVIDEAGVHRLSAERERASTAPRTRTKEHHP